MKNILLIFALILAFAGCKDDDEVEPEAVVYEDWQKVPSSEINLSNRNVLGLEGIGEELYIQCYNAFYVLDSNLKKVTNGYKNMNANPLTYTPRFGKEFSVINNGLGFDIFNNDNPVNSYYGYRVHYPSSVDDRVASVCFTNVNDSRKFDLLWAVQKDKDSVDYMLDAYEFNEYGNEPINFKRQKLPVYNEDRPTIRDIKRIDNVVFCTLNGLTYRVVDGLLQDSIRYKLTDIQKFKGGLIATSEQVLYIGTEIKRPDGIVYSADFGKTWNYLYTGFFTAKLKVVREEAYLIAGQEIVRLNAESATSTSINLDGMEDYVKDISAIGNKVVVGTDAGVYYKSWESFLNK